MGMRMRMAQEENNAYSGGGGGGGGGGRGGGGGAGGGGCRSKKIKPKKVPQRGLGVAQLEKIRLEEQQKKESLEAATTMMANNGIASSSSDPTSFLAAAHKFRPNLPPFHSPPPPPPPNAIYRHAQSVPNLEILQETCSVSNAAGGEIGSRPISSPRLWGAADYNHHHHHNHHHHGFAFDPPYDHSYTNTNMNTNTSVLSPPLMPHRSHHFQPPPSSIVQMNSSSGISPSSVLSSHLEPPSNQSSRRNIYATQWTDEDKMVGRKRSYPFSLESPPPPSTHGTFRPSFAASSSNRSDELEKSIRGSPSPLLDRMPNEITGHDEGLNGDFLSLAPPSTKLKNHHPSGYYQECAGSQMHRGESSGSVKQSFNFFPVKMDQSSKDGDDEKGDTIDLNLKL